MFFLFFCFLKFFIVYDIDMTPEGEYQKTINAYRLVEQSYVTRIVAHKTISKWIRARRLRITDDPVDFPHGKLVDAPTDSLKTCAAGASHHHRTGPLTYCTRWLNADDLGLLIYTSRNPRTFIDKIEGLADSPITPVASVIADSIVSYCLTLRVANVIFLQQNVATVEKSIFCVKVGPSIFEICGLPGSYNYHTILRFLRKHGDEFNSDNDWTVIPTLARSDSLSDRDRLHPYKIYTENVIYMTAGAWERYTEILFGDEFKRRKIK